MSQFESMAQTLDKDSWEWICANHPLVADALGVEVQRGASPSDLRDFVRRYLGYTATISPDASSRRHAIWKA